MPSIEQTLGNESWVKENAEKLRKLFPIKPTEINMALLISVGYKFKLMGVEWQNSNDLPKMFSLLQRLKIIDIETFQGKTYALQHMSEEAKAQHSTTQAMQESAERINQTEPPEVIKLLAAAYLDKFKKA